MYSYHKQTLMGRGDKKTAKGKRAMGSYGKTRKRKEDAPVIIVKKVKKAKPVKAEPKAKASTAAKKPAAKKTTTKKSE
jgi:30S ribosomal protein S31